MADTTTSATSNKSVVGTVIGVGITLAVIFAIAWAAGKGWKSSGA